MTPDTTMAAAGRTEAARNLIEAAQAEAVGLVTVSALELCALGGPKHPLFEEAVARAWGQLGGRKKPFGYRLTVRGDGITARLDGSGPGDGASAGTGYDVERLRSAMLDLITRPSR